MSSTLTFALFFASGTALFAGAAGVVISVLLSFLVRKNLSAMIGRLLLVVAVLMIALSAAPLPAWFYAIWGAAALWFLVRWARTDDERGRTIRVLVALVLLALTGGAAAWEARFLALPMVPASSFQRMVVFGDSITAGLNDNNATWPKLVGDSTGITVADHSAAGETLESALARIDKVPQYELVNAIVVVEVGGNDMLERAAPAKFAANLDALLAKVSGENCVVLLTELPLPPFHNRYGRIQRDAARKYGAKLVPKRVLAKAIGTPGSTVDGLHLSQTGQNIMAEYFGRVIQPGPPAGQ